MATATLPRFELPLTDRSGGGRLTLGQTLADVWEGLLSAGTAECPVCHGALVSAKPGSGVCRECGTSVA